MDLAGKYLGSGWSFLQDMGHKLKTYDLVFKLSPPYGMAVELDAQGRIITSLHSPDYETTLLSEVREAPPPKDAPHRRVLYLGSVYNNYLGKLIIDE